MSSEVAASRESESSGEAKEYEVEKLLDKRRKARLGWEYLVKWKGWGYEDLTWEPLSNLGNCPQRIEEFEKPGAIREDYRRAMKEAKLKAKKKLGKPVEGPSSTILNAGGRVKDDDDKKGKKWAKKKNKKTRGDAGPPVKNLEAGDNEEPGCSTGSTLFREMHPLLNPLILNTLFELCPLGQLATCRLICKTWYRESLRAWRASSMLTLRRSKRDGVQLVSANNAMHYAQENGDDEYKNPCPEMREPYRPKYSFPEFLDFFDRDCGRKPYRDFKLQWWNIGFGGILKLQQDRFWALVGHHVTTLELNGCEFIDIMTFRKVIFQACPNMRNLILDVINIFQLSPTDDEQPQGCPTQYTEPICGEHVRLLSLAIAERVPMSYLELLSHFPSLTTIRLSLSSYDFNIELDHDFFPLLNAIKIIRAHDPKKLPIKQIDTGYLGFIVTDKTTPAKYHELFDLIRELGHFDLMQKLVINFPIDVEVLQELLSIPGVGASIRGINAMEEENDEEYRRAPPCKFPFGVELSNLHVLIISDGFCKNLELIKYTPNLERLHISTTENSRVDHASKNPRTRMVISTSETTLGDVKLLKLKELWLGYMVSERDVRKLCRWMPNVEILSMLLTDEQFTVVCERWKNLTHIHQLGKRHLHDKGITGMGWDGNGHKIRPNITMLTNLYCFQYCSGLANLTVGSVNNGFLKLPKLQILDIASDKHGISDTAVKALYAKVPSCHVRWGEHNRWTPAPNASQPHLGEIRCEYFDPGHQVYGSGVFYL